MKKHLKWIIPVVVVVVGGLVFGYLKLFAWNPERQKLAMINDRKITVAQFDRELSKIPSPFQDVFREEPKQYLEQIIMKVLSKEPAARYRTADQLGKVLQSINTRSEVYPITPAPQASQPQMIAKPRPLGSTVEKISSVPIPMPPPAPLALQPRVRSGSEEDHSLDIDWLTILLGLLCTLAVGGLIPLSISILGTLSMLHH